MNGVTILQTVAPIASTTVLIFCLCGIVAIITLVLAIVSYADFDNIKWAIAFGIVSIIAVIGAIVDLNHPMYDKSQYQVIVDDSISMAEFTQRYHIIEQEGITYWVTEK